MDIRLWYGFVNQHASFLAMALIMTSTSVYWDGQQQKFWQAQDTKCQLAKHGKLAAITD